MFLSGVLLTGLGVAAVASAGAQPSGVSVQAGLSNSIGNAAHQGMVSPASSVNVQPGGVPGQATFYNSGNPAHQGMVPSASSVNILAGGVPGQSTLENNRNSAQEALSGSSPAPPATHSPGIVDPANSDGSAQQPYNAESLQLKLSEIAMEGRTLEQVECDVRNICGNEGIILTTFKSTSVPDGSGTRHDMKTFRCQHGGTNRQQYYQYSQDDAPAKLRRSRQSKCIGCKFEVIIRHAKSHPHPKLTNLKLLHNHLLDRDAMAVKLRLGGKLTGEQAEQVGKMAAEGMKPKAITTALTALHHAPVNHRTVQNHAAAQSGGERPMDASDFYEEVKAITADGGLCEVKMDTDGRMTHMTWMTKEQVTRWNRFGHVALYDDTAVKNRYRMPIGVLVVIDGEYRTRIVAQSITADTTTSTFVWMLGCWLEARGGKQPIIFIQDADAAMTGAAKQVLPGTETRRCLWHLYQNIMKNLAKVLGPEINAFMDQFKTVRQQLSLMKFEEKFNALCERYPKAEHYMGVIYEDRHRWAEYVSPLTFSVGPWTTSRVEGQNALIKDKCNTRTSLVDVLRCFAGIITSQGDRARLREAVEHLPAVRIDTSAMTAFKGVLDACKFPIGLWATRFMEQEMGAAILHCQLGGAEIDGPGRSALLQRSFEYIEEKLCDVTLVHRVDESRDGNTYPYHVLLFSDGSHLCQCRTLQTLGLGCRHFWAAMLQSKKFRFHIGLLHEHWLTEQARGTPQSDWPQAAAVKWVMADRHARPGGATGGFEGAAPDEGAALDSTRDGKWKAFTGSSQTLQTVLLELREKGPTLQDQQVLYADVSKRLNEASSILSESRSPAEAIAMAELFLQKVKMFSGTSGGGGSSIVFFGLPPTVRLPARSSNVRKRGAAEGSRARSKRAASSGSH